ncbi:hypothetical protein BJ875DRAFT_387047 [Amylocarpus encephaloides]|uniref:Cylicin I n=1 Tax=Amylocarpus encephaloides TaxID=45428 RepID=A0A9P7YA69_9HELO|nr:hypothetical protein BJ875DRAFT_387047 [Amylocarpus encephaloides]
MAESIPQSYSSDPSLYLYTSLTSGSSHIVTATSRLETILKANRIPFKALDIATDEKARMIWGRRAGKDESGRVRKMPGLVQEGMVLGDLVEIEEWNEYGEMKMHVKIVGSSNLTPLRAKEGAPSATPSSTPVAKENKKPEPVAAAAPPPVAIPKAPESVKSPTNDAPSAISIAMRQAGQEAAQKAKDGKKKAPETLSGVGKAEPTKEAEKAATPAPITVADLPLEKLSIADTTSLQSPGSSISEVSAEEIKKIEKDCAIPEEDENDDEEESDEDEDEDSEKEEVKKKA